MERGAEVSFGTAVERFVMDGDRVRGVVTATSDEDDSALAVQHNIRVFAQVEGPEKQAIATQGDLNSDTAALYLAEAEL